MTLKKYLKVFSSRNLTVFNKENAAGMQHQLYLVEYFHINWSSADLNSRSLNLMPNLAK